MALGHFEIYKRVKSPGISMHTPELDAVEVEYVGKLTLSHTVLKESSKES